MNANRVPPHLAGDTTTLLTDARLANIAARDRGSLWMPIAARMATELLAHRKLVADLLALLARMAGTGCEHVTTPGFHCERNGRTPDAQYGADHSCHSCDIEMLRRLVQAAS